ncbi:MAG: type II toxin-antitoxin system RelE/ParE family toxin [Bosea sp.]|uniref:type II toxin-antitoxin system RelE/ParE family toxin n=1 Tax=Bosea sp. (in: a-proteobacteria) TaxID=1871050 RepID=UPI00239B71B1|nr:type II toxin-antitoxin system RelE/ParE family toxin [Bosea sp. (in: a-proteobacteria)]MCP4740417.1 type II toxin-antitoxin system RelE/ParE family toxin [Bosea sp. (in: a-proteobacteria)]
MRSLLWSAAALDDFEAAIARIAIDDQTAARRVAAAVDRAARLLAGRPIGRPGRVAGTYEKTVSGLPWIIAYTIDGDRLVVLRVIHSSRDWPKEGWPG